jgi:hypothetical protein
MGISRLSAAVRGLVALASVSLAACEGDVGTAPDVALATSALRPDARESGDLPPFFDLGTPIEQFDSDSGFFRIHYVRSSSHAVPAADANSDDVPDYVEQVAAEYDAVLAFYDATLGYSLPLADDDGRFDVYLLDFPNSADGSFVAEQCLPDHPNRCTGYMIQENDFAGRNYPSRSQATRILASHELFHAVQNAYLARSSVVVSEGTAVWASETYDGTLHDFEAFVGGYLSTTEQSLALDPVGPVAAYAYGSALFFRYLDERFGRDTIRELWEALRDDPADEPQWIDALDRTLSERHQSSLAAAFEEFTRWNLYTGQRADPAVAYREGNGYPAVKEQTVVLPFEDPLVRVFPLAARFYSAKVATAGPIGVALDKPLESQQGLRVMLAREANARIIELASLEHGKSALHMDDVEAGDTVHLVLLNTRLSGESARPAICLGDPTELAACATAADPPNTSDEGSKRSSDGCSVASTRQSPLAILGTLIVLVVRQHRRWRRRRHRC